MAKLKVVYEATPNGPVAVAAYAEATATGEDTLATTKVKVDVNDHGRVTLARGTVNATATAQGDETYATAATGVTVDGADLTLDRTATSSGSGGGATTASSTTRFFAIDIEGVDFSQGPITIAATSDQVVVSQPAPIDGNVATFDVDVEAVGADTYAAVEAAVSTTSDFSDSTVTVMAMADTALF
jgi:hypothetical protein